MHANDHPTDGLDLSPFVIAALGHPALGQPGRPVERLIGLQAAVGRLIAWVAGLRVVRFSDQTATPTTRILVKN